MESSLPALPIELWHMILLLACIPSTVIPVCERKIILAPVALSHVCRSWRHLVINFPKFWTDISYRFDFSYSQRPSPDLMQLCLERSSGMPLTLDIFISYLDNPEDGPHVYEFLFALFAHRKRWKSATFSLEWETIDDKVWETIGALMEDAPLLERLHVMLSPGEPEERSDTFEFSDAFRDTLFKLWNGTPNLTKLAVEFMGTNKESLEPGIISDWILKYGIPYHQLTHLILYADHNRKITWDEVASIFALARNLVACSLYGIKGHDGRVRPSTPRVVLKYLQHLELSAPIYRSDENDTVVTSMNQILTAPSLQTFSLLRSEDMLDKDAYADFIARSNPPLTGLHIGPPDGSPQSLLECICLSPPTLQSVHTYDTRGYSREFFKEMSEWDEEAGKFKLCPVLQQLAFDSFTMKGSSKFPKRMVNMLRKRLCPPDGSSGSFNTLIVPTRLPREAQANLKSLKNDPYCLRVVERDRTEPEARVW